MESSHRKQWIVLRQCCAYERRKRRVETHRRNQAITPTHETDMIITIQ
jgi:hypothetical protein